MNPIAQSVGIVGLGRVGFQTERNATQDRQASAADLATLAAGLRILLVDDSQADRILIIAYLKQIQPMIDIAENGQLGVRLFETRHYDVVLMDVEMPVMDGHRAVREIRRIEKETGALPTPVFALTAHAFADVAVKAYEAGFTELLTKPIRRETLLAALATYGSSKGDRFTVMPPESDAAEASFRVRVEEGMEDIVPAYLEKRRAEVAVYRENLEAADFDAIRILAHKMKGTGSSYGFPRLTELGAAMEKAALQSDISAIREHWEAFAFYVERVELDYLS